MTSNVSDLVKPLEWVSGYYRTRDDDNGPKEGRLRRLFAWRACEYTIIKQDREDGLYIVRGVAPGSANVFPNLKAAKTAAQADYEARILAALTPSVAEVMAMADALARELEEFVNGDERFPEAQSALDTYAALAEQTGGE